MALGPLDALVCSMRPARDHAYVLLLRMVQRLHRAGQVWPAGESLPAMPMWGPYAPIDRTATPADVVQDYNAGVLSGDHRARAPGRRIPDRGHCRGDRRIQRRSFDRAAHLSHTPVPAQSLSGDL
ncbi:hypothetical protein [Streptomyces sp. NBC_01320]|uniref:hypothetical protein n=1 Tax=Streptomyces sp. NBC_01320 TaxID=2903824 RepID=UPI002E0E131B|nr:hypothetical protein OG395_16335 [Streptomyces sp. NBC_01320]